MNKPATGVIEKAAAAQVVRVPEVPADWHPVAARWFESLAVSGQSRWYEPSDWATAFLVAESISRDLSPQFVGVTAGERSEPIYESIPLKGASLSSYLKAMSSLLVTEGDRRRAGIELQRGDVVDADEVASVAAVGEYLALVQS